MQPPLIFNYLNRMFEIMNSAKISNNIVPSFLVMVLPDLAKNRKLAREMTMKNELIANEENGACIGDIKETTPRMRVELNARLPKRSPRATLQ